VARHFATSQNKIANPERMSIAVAICVALTPPRKRQSSNLRRERVLGGTAAGYWRFACGSLLDAMRTFRATTPGFGKREPKVALHHCEAGTVHVGYQFWNSRA
jgi:hypothetical protein